MSKRFFLSMAVITALFSIALYAFPQIDMAISRFFYQSGRGFLLEYYYAPLHLDIFRSLLVGITYGFLAAVTLMLLGGIFCSTQVKMPVSPKNCLFLLICFALAPGFLVNDVFKNHWGRARPNQVQAFGGDKLFTPAWVRSTQCEKNCSFTSGETANVFCYLALVFIARRKKLITGVILAVGGLAAFERIAQGDHFFSDTLLSGLFDYLLIWLIYHAMKKNYNIVLLEKKYVKPC